ncbi:MAG: transcriptional regulator [Desulfuromonas sp.]|nr:MAG: transcriptional regulator [Desulfuromonas sp.]
MNVLAPDVYAKNCPSRMVLDRISNKWSMLILNRLQEETVRFNQLRREIDGISQKVLSQSLKQLERDGLVRREAFPTVPVTVEYSITDLGQTLAETVHLLTHWAEKNFDAVLQAQQRYDASGG